MSSHRTYPDGTLFRAATAADVPAITAIEEASFSLPGERFGLRRVRHLTVSPRTIVFVAEAHSKVLGWIAAFDWKRGKIPWGRIYAIAVDPSVRGRKLGQRLMDAMNAQLQQRGAARIFLEVRADNHAAIGLYKKLDFVECKPLPNYYGHGIDGMRMVRVTASSPAASP